MQQDDTFATNLRFACATRRSISQICREIGINRQQFNRYINGEARPSAHNVARIAAFFGLSAEDFSLAPKLFEARMIRPERHRLEAVSFWKDSPAMPQPFATISATTRPITFRSPGPVSSSVPARISMRKVARSG